MSFFIRKGNKNPATGGQRKAPGRSRPPAKKQKFDSEDIESESDLDSDEAPEGEEHVSSSEDDNETAQEKRLRLAREYLSQLGAEGDEDEDDESKHDAIADRLKQDLLEQSGRVQREVAKSYKEPSSEDIRFSRGHQLPLTCIVISPDCKHLYTASKDCSIIKWCSESGRKVKTIPGGRKGTENKHVGHTAHVLCLAISSDSKFLVSGDMNNLILVWNPDTLALLNTFKGHKGPVSGLAFRKGSHQLFSGSHDRSVKSWNLDEMAYVETLFGHHDVITSIDSLTRERAITSGGRDASIRIWKIVEESQLVFNGHGGSIDCVALINEQHFVSGADDNSICLWSAAKKKPMFTVKPAHEGGTGQNWITALATLQNTDLIASGSKDGCIKLWYCTADFRFLKPLYSIPVTGFVNGLKFSSDGSFLAAAVGQEHRLGRWWRLKEAKNGICLIKLEKQESSASNSISVESKSLAKSKQTVHKRKSLAKGQ